MTRIAIIGAGSLVYTRDLCSDILLGEPFRDCTLSLMDLDADRLGRARGVVESIVAARGLDARVEAATDLRDAVRGADYVVTTFQQGGLAAYEQDIEIPRRYGVEQCVGDTGGPGAVFRALRTIPALLEICAALDAVAPDALLVNYVNPMAANCWAVDRASGRPAIGLCGSVWQTADLLASWVGVPYDEVEHLTAGINHQAFYLTFRHRGEDLYPRIADAAERPEIYTQDPIRIDLMRHFGYFQTESGGAVGDIVPYFRKSPEQVEQYVASLGHPRDDWMTWGRTGGYLEYSRARAAEEPDTSVPDGATDQRHLSPRIMEALETGVPYVVNANVPNRGLISNLPDGCCVEVPCLFDRNGVQPTAVGALPPQLAAMMRASTSVQEVTVEAALTGDRDAVRHAVALDPLTASACTLDQIRRMTDELIDAQARWLPQFAG